MRKEDEKKPLSWETVDPKPPVIRSGHLEDRCKNENQAAAFTDLT